MALIKKIFLFSMVLGLVSNAALANITVHDYTQKFNEGYERLKDKGPSNARKYILHYELVSVPKVCSIFFEGHPIPKDPRVEVDLKKYAKQLPELTKLYAQKVPEIKAIAAEVEQRSQKLFGMTINADVLLATSVSQTDAVTTGTDAKTNATVALNLRELVNYSKDDIRIVLAHELFHVLQHQTEQDPGSADPIAGNLYSEGWATYASSLVYPGFSDWKYISYFTKDDHQFIKFEADRKNIAHHLLKDWNKHSDRVFDKYFSADARASKPFEPRSGYYIGYLVAKTLAENQPPVQVALLNYLEFKKQVKPILKKMADV